MVLPTNNWALRFFSASMVAVALLGEPVCGTILAYFLFQETLTLVQAGGAALILAGIYLAARGEGRAPEKRRCSGDGTDKPNVQL